VEPVSLRAIAGLPSCRWQLRETVERWVDWITWRRGRWCRLGETASQPLAPSWLRRFNPGIGWSSCRRRAICCTFTQADHLLVGSAVDAAREAFVALATKPDEAITTFYDEFAVRLGDPAIAALIARRTEPMSCRRRARGRSTTRLELTQQMLEGMIAGLHVWRDTSTSRDSVTEVVEHERWTLTARRAPLGVVGFVFEGRPNVFADATGVLRSGNTAVLRIGSDRTRHSIRDCRARPAAGTRRVRTSGRSRGVDRIAVAQPPAGRCSRTVTLHSPSPAGRARPWPSSVPLPGSRACRSACTAPGERG